MQYFSKLQLRIGQITHAEFFAGAIKPAYQLTLSFGSYARQSSAQLVYGYPDPNDLIEFVSVTGFYADEKRVFTDQPEQKVENGAVVGVVDSLGAFHSLFEGKNKAKVSDFVKCDFRLNNQGNFEFENGGRLAVKTETGLVFFQTAETRFNNKPPRGHFTQMQKQKLGFSLTQTNAFVYSTWKDGSWSELETSTDFHLPIHIAATCLHYGQSLFEGLKAYRWKDGSVRLFRPDQNAKRMQYSACIASMAAPSAELFIAAVKECVKLNIDYVPEAADGTLYIRPFLFGSGPQMGLASSSEFIFAVYCSPVGNYYADGLKPVKALVVDDFDRAAPMGVGSGKLAGNYAPTILHNAKAKQQGYDVTLFLDAKTRTFVEEFSTSNFIGIKNGTKTTLVTPQSNSILQSVTRESLCAIAEGLGWKVEKRQVPFEELKEMEEAAACGTAVIITPVSEIRRGEEIIAFDGFQKLKILYNKLRAIQFGDEEDKWNWIQKV